MRYGLLGIAPARQRRFRLLRRPGAPWRGVESAGFSVLDIDYRGFGMSAGVPSETSMYADAEAAFDALFSRGVAPERIILLGHSLGSGPAVALATRHRAAALVLFGAFTSIPDAAAERYPWLPVRHVASVHSTRSRACAAVHIPVVVAHSRADTTIPYSHALKLYAAAAEPKRLLIFDVPSNDGFGGHVDALFDNVQALEAALSAVLPEPLRGRIAERAADVLRCASQFGRGRARADSFPQARVPYHRDQ